MSVQYAVLVTPKAYSIQSAAKALEVSPRYVEELIYAHRLPTIKLGRLRRILASDLDAFLAAQADHQPVIGDLTAPEPDTTD